VKLAQVEVGNMFISKEELGSVIYGYQLDQITEGDESIALEAINAAIEEVKSYLTGNNKKEWFDGRIQYDVEAIFNATGQDRNSIILAQIKTISKWHIVELSNSDIIYETAKERYDRAINYLNKLAKGEITLSSLPVKTEEAQGAQQPEPFLYGSRKKFNHE